MIAAGLEMLIMACWALALAILAIWRTVDHFSQKYLDRKASRLYIAAAGGLFGVPVPIIIQEWVATW